LADNYDALVGTNPVGISFSEYSLADPSAWDYLRPVLAENNGWALFIGTPRGENHFADLFKMAKDSPEWFAELQTVEDTGAISLDNIEREKQAGMPASMISQEFYCSFSSGVAGAFYGSYLDKAQEEGRIGNVAWEPASSVDTSWDLGFGDSTAIWFYQRVRKELRIIDYLEASGVGLEWYAKELDRKPYSYGSHTLPHDAAVRELGSGRSRVEILRGLGIGIAAVRSILNRCWFDESKCAQGLKALRSYRTEYNPKAQVFKPTPIHDWTSHAADAFRYLAVGLERIDRRERNRNSVLWAETSAGRYQV